jgi:hypothetical protein
MLKDHRIIAEIGKVMKESAGGVADRVIGMHTEVKGKEEEIIAQFASEITLHLLEDIQHRLNGRQIKDVKFSVYVYRKRSEEPYVGADLAGVLEMNLDGVSITKTYLAQAKVGKIVKGSFKDDYVVAKDSRVLGQAYDMLRITPSSYIFLYSAKGIEVVPAQEVRLANSNTISTQRFYTRTLGSFYEEFFKCFIGDNKLTPYPIKKTDLEYFAQEVNVKNVLIIKCSNDNSSENQSRFANIDLH